MQVMAGALECMEGTRDVRRGHGLVRRPAKSRRWQVEAADGCERGGERKWGWSGEDAVVEELLGLGN